jgi:hypothetical protein
MSQPPIVAASALLGLEFAGRNDENVHAGLVLQVHHTNLCRSDVTEF